MVISVLFGQLYTIYLNDIDGSVLRYTDRPANSAAGYTYNGESYLSRGVTHNNIVEDVSGELGSFELVLENLNNDLRNYFMLGYLKKAVVSVQGISNWTDTDYNNFLITAKVNKTNSAFNEITLFLSNIAERKKLRIRTPGKDCQFNFWDDPRCGVVYPVTADFEYTLDENKTSAGILYINEGSDPDVEASDELDESELIIKDSDGTAIRNAYGVTWTKISAKEGTISLRTPLKASEVPNDADWTVEIRKQCNRTAEHCQFRHDNRARYGGFLTIGETVKGLTGVSR